MTAQQLKNSILQMAVQGKLVPQDPSDEPASVLLERIRKEKEQLIKEGKIKREKNPSVIFRGADNTPYEKIGNADPVSIADEVPFEIPDTWEWARLQTICTKLVDGDHNPPKGESFCTDYIMASSTNINRDSLVDLDKVRYLSRETFLKENERTSAALGDIFFTSVGSLGRSCIFDGSVNICFQRSVSVISTLILNEYLKFCFDSGYFQNKVQKEATGTAQKGFYLNQLASSLIPVPPHAEQVRIVLKIQKYLPILEEYEKQQLALDILNEGFPDALKKSILQMAIQGKLVPQDPSDEPAEVLLERIREEKARLVKEGKIKKDKHESVIFRRDNSHYEKLGTEGHCIDDEIPFDIPDTWCWVRLGELFQHNTGKALNSSNTVGTKLTYITTSNLYWDRFELDKLREMLFTESEIEKCTVSKDDLLVCEGGDIGRAAIWSYNTPMRIQNHIHRLRAFSPICVRFFYYVFFLYKHIGLIGGKGIGIQGLSSNAIHRLLMPLPPLAEQERITERIETVIPYCEYL